MKIFRFIIPVACALVIMGCKESNKTAVMTPRIPVVSSQGIAGPENPDRHQDLFNHLVVVKDGWLQP